MKALILLQILLISSLISVAQLNQDDNSVPSSTELKPLSQEEELELRALPQLKLPKNYRNRSLPAVVDNSTQPYMRGVFQQTGLCCGQAAGIAYNFTYEIDRARDLPATITENLYPTHFTWNWMHGGQGWYGVSYLHSFQILRHCGNVNVADYGGYLSAGGHERWMSGYSEYYQGMNNRISSIYQIRVDTPEGLEIFKHWINDHLAGDPVGGVGSFYSQYMSATNTLPAGTPEAGKYVLTSFGGSANHAQTIVGYNDSIRWDYNYDGQYTNHIDINYDGVVDMKDWEIGGFKMVQSYGGVPNWGDQGYAYMMYKTVADKLGEGGIWNNCVHVLNVKEECHPQATMKVNLTYDSRERIKVIAGVSNDPGATSPQYVLEFPIFNFQGGLQYMQGGNSDPGNKTIEFGLDISPLLSEIELGQDVKFFLQIIENDPYGFGTGQVNTFSVYDYTVGSTEIISPQSNVTINDNGITTLSLLANFNFDRINIVDESLTPTVPGQIYSHQLTASGGEAPYTFKLVKMYDETDSAEAFPMVSHEQLIVSNYYNGIATKELDFEFPFYDSVYTSITAHIDGYLMFDEQLFPYPYFMDNMVLFRISRHISPFMCHDIGFYPAEGDGLWYEGDTSHATFRWKASIDGFGPYSDLNFAVSLYPSGEIKYYYGDIELTDDVTWVSGLCDGNEDDMQFSSFYLDSLPAPDHSYEYTRYVHPDGLVLSDNGVLSGILQDPVSELSLTFKVTDNNFVFNTKSLPILVVGMAEKEQSYISLNVFPNPFYDHTSIILNLAREERISIKVVSLTGTTIAVIAKDELLKEGEHRFEWDTSHSSKLASGMYLIVVDNQNAKLIRKVIRHE